MDKRVAKSLVEGYKALQTPLPGAQPVPGYVPALGDVLAPIAVYDNDSGLWVGLPLQALTKALLVAEQMDVQDILDSRNEIVLTLPKGTAKGVTLTQAYAIPAGEDWWISAFELITDATGDVTGNFIISRFPPVSGAPKPFLAADQAVKSDTWYTMGDPKVLGANLRMLGGEIITVTGTTTAALAATAELVTLIPYGHKANRLV